MNPSVPPPPSAAPPDPAGTPIAADAAHVESLRPVAYLELKAAMLLLFTLALIVGSGLYLLYARGAFEPTQTLVLTADDSEGVVVGMDMTFSGFPIGRVRRIELAETGNARIVVDVAQKDAHWLRESSVFTLVRGVVGGHQHPRVQRHPDRPTVASRCRAPCAAWRCHCRDSAVDGVCP